jgi:hypothetical protein
MTKKKVKTVAVKKMATLKKELTKLDKQVKKIIKGVRGAAVRY